MNIRAWINRMATNAWLATFAALKVLLQWKNAALLMFFVFCMSLSSIGTLLSHMTLTSAMVGSIASAVMAAFFAVGGVVSMQLKRRKKELRYLEESRALLATLPDFRQHFAAIASPDAWEKLLRTQPDRVSPIELAPNYLGMPVVISKEVPPGTFFFVDSRDVPDLSPAGIISQEPS